MKFQQYNLGHQTRGTVVEVTLSGSAANVRLLDSTNFQSYRSGRRHQYIGGLITKSPAQLTIPRTGSWHVTVDMRGLRGQTRSSIRVIPREAITPLPEYSPPQLASMVRPVHTPNFTRAQSSVSESYDVFICHATEDKDEVARPLADALVNRGSQSMVRRI